MFWVIGALIMIVLAVIVLQLLTFKNKQERANLEKMIEELRQQNEQQQREIEELRQKLAMPS